MMDSSIRTKNCNNFAGVASEKYNKQVAAKEKSRPTKSHYGSQVPGKPKRNNDFLSEIQTKLTKRRDKVDAESYVVETPDHLVVVETLPPSGHVRNGDTLDYRRMSKDSGRCSLTPSLDGDGQRRYSVDYSQYRRVSVDHDRKEELILAKEVRKSSVKMMRASPSPSSDFSDSATLKDSSQSPETIPSNLPPPSPVVMRYWKQCAGAIDDDDENPDEGRDENDEGNLLNCYNQIFPITYLPKVNHLSHHGKLKLWRETSRSFQVLKTR